MAKKSFGNVQASDKMASEINVAWRHNAFTSKYDKSSDKSYIISYSFNIVEKNRGIPVEK